MLGDYVEELLAALEGTRIFDPQGDPPLDEKVLASIQTFLPYRDEFVELALLLGRHVTDITVFEAFVPLFERAAPMVEPPENVSSFHTAWYDNFAFLLWEIFLYWIAALIEIRRFDIVKAFLERRYYIASRFAQSTLKTFGSFESHIVSLDELRKQRLKLQRLSVAADTLKERAHHKVLTFEKLMQTDVILFARSLVDQADHGGTSIWYPKTLVYAGYHRRFELFERATSRAQAAPVLELLGFGSVEAMQTRLAELLAAERRLGHMHFHWEVSIPTLLNLERIGSVS